MEIRKRIKLICGVGINDADYKLFQCEKIRGKRKIVWICPFYRKWVDMMVRCYNVNYQNRHPSYKGCLVCEEWLYFSNFKRWMETKNYENKQLDKDLLIPGNKIYSPETCVFVDKRVNSFLVEKQNARGEWSIGVIYIKKAGKFRADCWSIEEGKQKSLGLFSTPEEAHKAWLCFKLEQARILAAQQTDERVAKALIDRYENYG